MDRLPMIRRRKAPPPDVSHLKQVDGVALPRAKDAPDVVAFKSVEVLRKMSSFPAPYDRASFVRISRDMKLAAYAKALLSAGNVSQCARIMGVNRAVLGRDFRAMSGLTPGQYLRMSRDRA